MNDTRPFNELKSRPDSLLPVTSPDVSGGGDADEGTDGINSQNDGFDCTIDPLKKENVTLK